MDARDLSAATLSELESLIGSLNNEKSDVRREECRLSNKSNDLAKELDMAKAEMKKRLEKLLGL